MSADAGRLALERLLGPRAAEIGCEECFDQLDVYVELELEGADPEATLPGFRSHLEGCPACRDEHDALRALAQRLSPSARSRARRRAD